MRFSEDESIVPKSIAVDWDLDFNTDAAYFGTTYGNHTNGWNGKMRRILMDNGSNPAVPANWTLDSTMLDVTNIKVYENGTTLSDFSGSFQDLADFIENQKKGWRLEFDYKTGQRNLGEAVLAGDLLTFTTYVPSDEPCSIAGDSQVYALYYRTGTAYINSIIGLDLSDKSGNDALVVKVSDLGMRMTITPNIHVGREAGSQAYIQTSTGSIKPLEEKNPGLIKSGRLPVKPGDQTCP